MASAKKAIKKKSSYDSIFAINGDHPFKEQVPQAYVEYQARIRPGGKVFLFNFPLAKEMGLIPKDHPHELNEDLCQALIETFGLIIINEWDITNKKKFDQEKIKPGRYMATRYLQLQHPDRVGLRSGDGRSIWNGLNKAPDGRLWDLSSCGTGATCLSPAAAINNVFYKSGDPEISYGCGYSHLSEGMTDLLFSEVFHRNGVGTERVLAVIEFPGQFGVTVRAGLNLLRPSHFFNHLRQNQWQRLKDSLDFFIDREIKNKTWSPPKKGVNRYDHMLKQVTRTFAKATAVFEAEYIFCWLDWDGDNVLANGGIIDFGSIRQFGLYHHTYRFDDDERWSTNIKEQKQKAKHILMSFAQARDYLVTGKKKSHDRYRQHKCLKEFDRLFEVEKRRLLLWRMGFQEDDIELLLKRKQSTIKKFEKIFNHFEMAKAQKGPIRVPDGITFNAVYCLRDVLRELPHHFELSPEPISAKEFMTIMKSRYADREALRLTSAKKRRIRDFQKYYLELMTYIAKSSHKSLSEHFSDLSLRADVINQYDRITGDSMCVIGDRLTELRKKLSPSELFCVIEAFLERQVVVPESRSEETSLRELSPKARKILEALRKIVVTYREGI